MHITSGTIPAASDTGTSAISNDDRDDELDDDEEWDNVVVDAGC